MVASYQVRFKYLREKIMSNDELITALKNILGQEKVATDEKKTEYYRKGFRAGGGGALAVLFPDSLLKRLASFKSMC